jgi:hypothetical protein
MYRPCITHVWNVHPTHCPCTAHVLLTCCPRVAAMSMYCTGPCSLRPCGSSQQGWLGSCQQQRRTRRSTGVYAPFVDAHTRACCLVWSSCRHGGGLVPAHLPFDTSPSSAHKHSQAPCMGLQDRNMRSLAHQTAQAHVSRLAVLSCHPALLLCLAVLSCCRAMLYCLAIPCVAALHLLHSTADGTAEPGDC